MWLDAQGGIHLTKSRCFCLSCSHSVRFTGSGERWAFFKTLVCVFAALLVQKEELVFHIMQSFCLIPKERIYYYFGRELCWNLFPLQFPGQCPPLKYGLTVLNSALQIHTQRYWHLALAYGIQIVLDCWTAVLLWKETIAFEEYEL